MFGGVANGSCELKIVMANDRYRAATYKSHGGTDSVSKFAEEEVLDCSRFAQWRKNCRQAGLRNSTISTESNDCKRLCGPWIAMQQRIPIQRT